MLQAAVAAAQSERESLSLFIEQAMQLEATRLSARLAGAPIITAHEAAGELWLQVHRYEDARRAYHASPERSWRDTARSRSVWRGRRCDSKTLPEACQQYQYARRRRGTGTGPEPPEIVEARAVSAGVAGLASPAAGR